MKKSNLVIVIISLLLVLSFSFIIITKLNERGNLDNQPIKDNNSNIDNNNNESNQDNPLIPKIPKEKISYKDDFFEVKVIVDEEHIGFPDVYLNNVLVAKNTCTDGTPIENINNKYIALTFGCESTTRYIYNTKGEQPFLVDDFDQRGLNYENNILTLYYQNKDTRYIYIPDYEGALCKNSDTTVVVTKIIKYDMNDNEKVISETELNVDDIVKRRYNVNCEELKKSDDPKLAYQKELATGN